MLLKATKADPRVIAEIVDILSNEETIISVAEDSVLIIFGTDEIQRLINGLGSQPQNLQ